MKYANKSASAGFTLIELMIAIGIVAILVAMAVPAYQNYSVRAKVTECINNSAVAKVQVSEYRQSLGSWPPAASDAGLESAGTSFFCNGFTNYDSATGEFAIDVNETSVDLGIVGQISPLMTPTPTSARIINWNCSPGTTSLANLKYLPATCRGS
ncbi:MAG: pilin [Gammaproteobacteria bacterium]|nr:pilin [Gammaproteobacteria bacterium]